VKQEYTYKLVKEGEVTNVEVTPHPDWEEFDQFVELFIYHEGATLIAQDIGMDRHQVRYRKGQHQFILQFEHYTGSIWIETDF
jgi:hypothetical protein